MTEASLFVEDFPMNDLVKPGWKTTEFWLNLVAIVVAFLIANGFGEDNETWVAKGIGMVAVILASFGYGFSRASVKKAASNTGR